MREFKYNVIQLIHGVRDRPCLWDKSIENYKDRVERRSAWEEIFHTLDETYDEMTPEEKRITGEQILNKWTNIRDTFVKTLKSKMGRPKKKYLLYDHLKFLTKIIPEAERNIEYEESTPFMKQETEPDTSFTDTTSGNNYAAKKRSKRSDFDETKSADYNLSEVSYGSKKKKSKRFIFADDNNDSKDSIFSKKRSKKGSVKDTTEEINDVSADDHLTGIDFVEVDDNDPRIMNEDEAFFASLLPTIVKYNEDERLEFRMEVLGVMKKIKDKRKWLGD